MLHGWGERAIIKFGSKRYWFFTGTLQLSKRASTVSYSILYILAHWGSTARAVFSIILRNKKTESFVMMSSHVPRTTQYSTLRRSTSIHHLSERITHSLMMFSHWFLTAKKIFHFFFTLLVGTLTKKKNDSTYTVISNTHTHKSYLI